MNYLNLVELLKTLVLKFVKGKKEKKITASRTTVDIFIILKWLFISIIWFFNVKNSIVNYFVWYLIFSNIFTYFYHHTWSNKIAKQQFDIDRIKRRYLNLMLSIGFNVYSFAYFYAKPFVNNFNWSNNVSSFKESLNFSLSKSLSLSYNKVSIITDIGNEITNIETIISFIFLTIILSSTIPQIKN